MDYKLIRVNFALLLDYFPSLPGAFINIDYLLSSWSKFFIVTPPHTQLDLLLPSVLAANPYCLQGSRCCSLKLHSNIFDCTISSSSSSSLAVLDSTAILFCLLSVYCVAFLLRPNPLQSICGI